MRATIILALFALLLLTSPFQLQGQTGTIEFAVRAAPTIGNAEPVRKHTFYLLRQSYAAIRQEVAELEPGADLEKFVDDLQISPELRAWMKRTKRVELSGQAFVRELKTDDVIDVPEFRQAYRDRNVTEIPLGFPKPKYSAKDRTRNTQKYQRQEKEFLKRLREYLVANPQSLEGIDNYLSEINPAVAWGRLQRQWQERVDRHARRLAETRYLAARVETDLEGNARISGVLPGHYWLSNLNNYAPVGDLRLAWEVPLEVLPGRLTLLELSNANALPPPTAPLP